MFHERKFQDLVTWMLITVKHLRMNTDSSQTIPRTGEKALLPVSLYEASIDKDTTENQPALLMNRDTKVLVVRGILARTVR